MKHTFFAIITIAGLLLVKNAQAQSSDEKKKKKTTFEVSGKGIFLKAYDTTTKAKAEQENKQFTNSLSMDLGFNYFQDNTNYSDPAVINYLSNVPPAKKNADLFSLKQSKSINVNLYWMESFRALKTKGQRIIISTGLGLQLYNFRFDNNITYTKNPSTVKMDSLSFSKNKLGMDYLNVPLMFTFKTRLYANKTDHKKDKWLVYGAGITAGYAISTWTKQISGEAGKVKLHDDFSFNKFNSCVTAEFGLEGVIRLYASYQLTSMYSNGLDVHPIAIGLKISGI